MPCYDPPMSGPSYSELNEVKDELNKVSAMLCSLLRVLSSNNTKEETLSQVDQQLLGMDKNKITEWYEKHKKFDERRGL